MYIVGVKKLLFLAVFILLLWAFFATPAKELAATYEAGFPIERLTYLPEGYGDVDEDKYFTLSKYVPGNSVVETEYHSGDNYFKFIQAPNNYALEVYVDALDAGTFFKKESFIANDMNVEVRFYNDDRLRFVWLNGPKRYDLVTNDLSLGRAEIEKIQSSLVPAKVNFWRPLKKAWQALIGTTDLFSSKNLE